MMNRIFTKILSLALAVVLCFGLVSVTAFAESDTLTYVALGDSMSQGYMFTDYNEDPNADHCCGWEGTSERSYIKEFAKDLEKSSDKEVKLIDLTIQGLQPDEVYAFLQPETFNFDSMTKGARKHIGWWTGEYQTDEEQDSNKYIFRTFEDMSDYYIDSIKKADVITYDIGMNYFGTYLNDARGEDEVFTKLLPDNFYTQQVENVRRAVSDLLGRSGMEAIGSRLNGLLYAYVSYMVYTDKCISAINALNPDAQIILVPLSNPHKDLYIDVNGLKIGFSDVIDLMLESLNAYMKYTSPNRNLYTIAQLSGSVTSFADELYKYPNDLSEDIEVLLETAMMGNNSVLGMAYYPVPAAFTNFYENMKKIMLPDDLMWFEFMLYLRMDESSEVMVDEDGNYLMLWNVFDRLIYDYISDRYGEDVAYADFFGNYLDGLSGIQNPEYMVWDPCLMGDTFKNWGYPDMAIYPDNVDRARAAIADGTADDWQEHLIEAIDTYYGNNWIDICKEAATYRTFPLDAFTQGMSGDLSGFDPDKVIEILRDPDTATADDYIAIHLALRFGQASRGFGAHPCPRGLEVKHNAVLKAYRPAADSNPPTCHSKKPVCLSQGVHSLYLNGKDMGEFTFAPYNDGWSIKSGEQYLAMENGKLVLSDEAFAWTYTNGAFSASVTTTQRTGGRWFGWFYIPGSRKTVTTTYYLNRVSAGDLSTSIVRAGLYDLEGKIVNTADTFPFKQIKQYFSLFDSKKIKAPSFSPVVPTKTFS